MTGEKLGTNLTMKAGLRSEARFFRRVRQKLAGGSDGRRARLAV